jgi:hypothetical protein
MQLKLQKLDPTSGQELNTESLITTRFKKSFMLRTGKNNKELIDQFNPLHLQ